MSEEPNPPTSQARASGRSPRQLIELAALAGAIVIALAAVGAFAIGSGGGDGGPTTDPESVVAALYDAAEANDLALLGALIVPELREDFTRASVAFGATPFAPAEEATVTFTGLTFTVVTNEAGWAAVAVSGEFQTANATLARPVAETIYLRKDATWLVASQALFVRTFRTPGPATSTAAGARLGPLDPQRPKVGEPAPDFALFDARDGRTVRRLSDFRGQAVVVNWYASWCDPCKREVPDFEKASQALAGSVVFLGVDYLESRDKAVGILDRLGATYPAVLDSEGSVADHYRVGGGLPVTFFVDKDGILRGMRIGEVEEEALVENLAKVGVTYTPAN